MALVASSHDLPLADFIQVKAQTPQSWCLQIDGLEGRGYLCVDHTEIVYAHYGERSGEVAAYAMLGEDRVWYRTVHPLRPVTPNMRLHHQEALLEAMRLVDERSRRPDGARAFSPPSGSISERRETPLRAWSAQRKRPTLAASHWVRRRRSAVGIGFFIGIASMLLVAFAISPKQMAIPTCAPTGTPRDEDASALPSRDQGRAVPLRCEDPMLP